MKHKKLLIISCLVVLVVLALFFYPKEITTCRGTSVCYGFVKKDVVDTTWFNWEESRIYVRGDVAKSCIGREVKKAMIMDGCPGDWGWIRERPVVCENINESCEDGGFVFNISCSEWTSSCEQLKLEGEAHINTENFSYFP